ncbi:MAG: hypothetical protein P8X80_19665 [Desulfobacterales bacterium]
MSFKENLLTKIRIDRLAASVIASIGPVESGSKVDRDAMRSLLEMSPYQHQKERDLDLYVKAVDQEQKIIFVLDNELPTTKLPQTGKLLWKGIIPMASPNAWSCFPNC